MKKYIKCSNGAPKMDEYGQLEIKIPDELWDFNVGKYEIIDFLDSFDEIARNVYHMDIEDGGLFVEVKESADVNKLNSQIIKCLNHLVNEVKTGR